jgi:flagellar protein FlaG
MDAQLGRVALPTTATSTGHTVAVAGTNGPKRTATQPAQQPAAAPVSLSDDVTAQVADQINEFLKSTDAKVQFEVERGSKEVVVRIVDALTREVIRQVPSEEMLAISKALDRMSGLLMDQIT